MIFKNYKFQKFKVPNKGPFVSRDGRDYNIPFDF